MSQHDFSVTSASDSRRVGSLGDVPTPNVLLSTVGGVVPWLTPTILRRACGEHWPLALALDVEMHLPARPRRLRLLNLVHSVSFLRLLLFYLFL